MTCEEFAELNKRPLTRLTIAERFAARSHVSKCAPCARKIIDRVASMVASGTLNMDRFNEGRALAVLDDLKGDPEAAP